MSAPTSAHSEAWAALGVALARLAAEWWRAHSEQAVPHAPVSTPPVPAEPVDPPVGRRHWAGARPMQHEAASAFSGRQRGF
jgi:hypothetical protein